MIWVIAGAVFIAWIALKTAQGKSRALDELSDREADLRAERLVAEVRRESAARDEKGPGATAP